MYLKQRFCTSGLEHYSYILIEKLPLVDVCFETPFLIYIPQSQPVGSLICRVEGVATLYRLPCSRITVGVCASASSRTALSTASAYAVLSKAPPTSRCGNRSTPRSTASANAAAWPS